MGWKFSPVKPMDFCQLKNRGCYHWSLHLERKRGSKKTQQRGYKTHMLGNIKLVGGLLARGMLAAKAPFSILYV